MPHCHCGSDKPFAECCEPILKGAPAPTAEALMRARYSAYVVGDVAFLKESLAPSERCGFDPEQVRNWSRDSKWLGLTIHSVEGGGAEDEVGQVDFTAAFEYRGSRQEHHESADFKRIGGVWRYVDGRVRGHVPIVRSGPKIGRNDPCPCGSGKKYKKCCGA